MKSTKLRLESLENRSMMAAYSYADAQVAALVAKNYADGLIDRKEAIEIFQSLADDGGVDSKEMVDIKYVAKLNMADDTRYFSNSILSSPANKTVKSLSAGLSSADSLRLVDKWFLGKDRPVASTSTTYQPVNGSLFVNGANHNDVRQGYAGTCYFLAALQGLATKNNTTIQQMFKDNGDSTWTITFYMKDSKGSFVKEFVTVDNYLPVTKQGFSYYTSFGGDYRASSNELWVSLAEKGYAQWSEKGNAKIPADTKTNSYANIGRGGWSDQAFVAVSGTQSTQTFVIKDDLIQKALSENKAVVVYRYMDAKRQVRHAMFIKSYSPETGRYDLQNPWGHQHLSLSSQELKASCYGYAICGKIG